MKKKNKIITAALGSATLGVGLSVAAVAQACGPTTADPNIATIETGVNLLSSYTSTAAPTNQIAIDVLESINTALGTSESAFTTNRLNFTAITATSVVPSGTTYAVTISGVTGFGRQGGNIHTISGNAQFTITDANGTLTVGATTTLTSTNQETNILTQINQLSAYTGTQTLSGLGTELLAAINYQVNAQDAGQTVTGITFNNVDTGDISIATNNSEINVAIASMTGTVTNGRTLTGLSAVVRITVSNGVLSINPMTGVTNIMVPASPQIAVIIAGVNLLGSYTSAATAPTNDVAIDVLASFTTTLTGAGNAFTINRLNFADITSDNITTSGATYTVTIPAGITGFGVQDASIHTISGNAQFTITDANGTLTVGATTILTSMEQGAEIVDQINQLSSYVQSPTPTPTLTGLGVQFLAAINVQVNTQDAGQTVATTDFSLIDATNVTIAANNTDLDVTIASLTGTATGGRDLTGTSVVITISVSDNALSISNVSAITVAVNPQVAAIVAGITALNGYDASATSNLALTESIITLLNPRILNATTTIARINGNAFDAITPSNINAGTTPMTWTVDVEITNGAGVTAAMALAGQSLSFINGPLSLLFTLNGQDLTPTFGVEGPLDISIVPSDLPSFITNMNDSSIRNITDGTPPTTAFQVVVYDAILAQIATQAGGPNVFSLLTMEYDMITLFDVSFTNDSYTVVLNNFVSTSSSTGGVVGIGPMASISMVIMFNGGTGTASANGSDVTNLDYTPA